MINFRRYLPLFFLIFAFAPFTSQGQADSSLAYIDSLSLLIEQEERGSFRQQDIAAELRQRLFDSLKEKIPQEQRDLIWQTLNHISSKKGRYIVLNRYTQPDTLSSEILAYEQTLQKLQDSILAVQQKLMEIIDAPNSRSTKERAVFTLAKIHSPEVIQYLWDHEEKLNFGLFDSEDFDEELYRTALIALDTEYLQPESGEKRWLLLPGFLHSLRKIGLRELVLLMEFFNKPPAFNAPWLLLDFILVNTEHLSEEEVQELNGYLKQVRKGE